MPKSLTVWITVKLWKILMQVKKQQLEPDMEQQTEQLELDMEQQTGSK